MAVKIISGSTPQPRRVLITISGDAASGKTIVAAAIAEFLDKAGIEVRLEDADIADFRTFALKADQLDDIGTTIEATVKTQNTVRPSSFDPHAR